MKVLQVNTGEPPSLVGASSLDTPAELLSDPGQRLEYQLSELPRLIRKGGFKGKRAVIAIPPDQTLCKALQTARIEGLSLSEVVSHALAEQLECHPEALVCRPIEAGTGTRSGKSEILGIATTREMVDRLLGGLRHARLEPVGIHSEYVALTHAFSGLSMGEERDSSTTLFLDVGAGSSKVVIATNGTLSFARQIEVGAASMVREIERQLDCGFEEAERVWRGMESMDEALPTVLKRAAGAESMDAAPMVGEVGARRRAMSTSSGADLTEPLEILTDEISMATRYHESVFPQRRLERVLFVGGASRQVGFCQHVAKAVRLTAQIADPMARVARSGKEPCVNVDLTQPQPGWAVALGLCSSPTDL
ncbi:MAG: pilus assembly protein PilM [Planctomycetota bacterium]